MEIIKHYIASVSEHLPDEQRNDIAEELKSTLYEEVDDQQNSLNRSLTEEEIHDILKQHGHPAKVAASYSNSHYLIGPELYTTYKHVLKTSIHFVMAIQITLSLFSIILDSSWLSELPGLFSRLFHSFIWTVGIITSIFALLEYTGDKIDIFKNWDPKNLPKSSTYQVDKTDNVINLVFECIALMWWNNIVTLPNDILLKGETWSVELASVWEPLFWPINIVLVSSILLHLYQLFFPKANAALALLEVLISAVGLIILSLLLMSSSLFNFSSHTGESELDSLFSSIEKGVWWTLLIIAGFVVYEIIIHSRRYFKLKH